MQHRRHFFSTILGAAAICIYVGSAAFAHDGSEAPAVPSDVVNETPRALKQIGITEHLGEKIDLDTKFRDEAGAVVPLRTYFKKGKPVLLTLAYFNCPGLCSFHLNGLTNVFKKLNWTIGREFDVVVVSFDAKEKSPLAAAKKESYLRLYDRDAAAGWHFLTGDSEQIKKLAEDVGFSFRWDTETQQYAHASAAYILTPEGRISRYLYGIDFEPRTVRLSLVEASDGIIGNVVDKLILYCFHYDPQQSKYAIAAMNIMRFGGGMIVLILAAFIFPYWRRQRKNERLVRQEQGNKRLQGEV